MPAALHLAGQALNALPRRRLFPGDCQDGLAIFDFEDLRHASGHAGVGGTVQAGRVVVGDPACRGVEAVTALIREPIRPPPRIQGAVGTERSVGRSVDAANKLLEHRSTLGHALVLREAPDRGRQVPRVILENPDRLALEVAAQTHDHGEIHLHLPEGLHEPPGAVNLLLRGYAGARSEVADNTGLTRNNAGGAVDLRGRRIS